MIESVQNNQLETNKNNNTAIYNVAHILFNLITIKAIKIKFDGFFIKQITNCKNNIYLKTNSLKYSFKIVLFYF